MIDKNSINHGSRNGDCDKEYMMAAIVFTF